MGYLEFWTIFFREITRYFWFCHILTLVFYQTPLSLYKKSGCYVNITTLQFGTTNIVKGTVFLFDLDVHKILVIMSGSKLKVRGLFINYVSQIYVIYVSKC